MVLLCFTPVSLLKDLKHANIVTLHDIVHTDKSLTLVFEYLVRLCLHILAWLRDFSVSQMPNDIYLHNYWWPFPSLRAETQKRLNSGSSLIPPSLSPVPRTKTSSSTWMIVGTSWACRMSRWVSAGVLLLQPTGSDSTALRFLLSTPEMRPLRPLVACSTAPFLLLILQKSLYLGQCGDKRQNFELGERIQCRVPHFDNLEAVPPEPCYLGWHLRYFWSEHLFCFSSRFSCSRFSEAWRTVTDGKFSTETWSHKIYWSMTEENSNWPTLVKY